MHLFARNQDHDRRKDRTDRHRRANVHVHENSYWTLPFDEALVYIPKEEKRYASIGHGHRRTNETEATYYESIPSSRPPPLPLPLARRSSSTPSSSMPTLSERLDGRRSHHGENQMDVNGMEDMGGMGARRQDIVEGISASTSANTSASTWNEVKSNEYEILCEKRRYLERWYRTHGFTGSNASLRNTDIVKLFVGGSGPGPGNDSDADPSPGSGSGQGPHLADDESASGSKGQSVLCVYNWTSAVDEIVTGLILKYMEDDTPIPSAASTVVSDEMDD